MDDFLLSKIEEARAEEGDQTEGQFFETFAEIFYENPVIDGREGDVFYAHGEEFRRIGPGRLAIPEGEFINVRQFKNLKDGLTAQGERKDAPPRPDPEE